MEVLAKPEIDILPELNEIVSSWYDDSRSDLVGLHTSNKLRLSKLLQNSNRQFCLVYGLLRETQEPRNIIKQNMLSAFKKYGHPMNTYHATFYRFNGFRIYDRKTLEAFLDVDKCNFVNCFEMLVSYDLRPFTEYFVPKYESHSGYGVGAIGEILADCPNLIFLHPATIQAYSHFNNNASILEFFA